MAREHFRQAGSFVRASNRRLRLSRQNYNRWTRLQRVDHVWAHCVEQGNAGSDSRIRERESREPDHAISKIKQPGVLRAVRLPAAGFTETMEAVLPVRICPHPEVRYSFSTDAESCGLRRRAAVRFLEFCSVEIRVSKPTPGAGRAAGQRRFCSNELHVLK